MSSFDAVDPALLDAVRSAGLDATGTPGSIATDIEYRTEAAVVVAEYARTLARLHAIEPPSTSVVLDADAVSARARADLGAGRLDDLALSAPYRHLPVTRLVEVLGDGTGAAAARASEPVPTHGRPALSSFRWVRHDPIGLLDWGSLRLADRNRDLAVAARSVAFDLDASFLPVFFDAYGHDHLDLLQLDWYSLALELEPSAS